MRRPVHAWALCLIALCGALWVAPARADTQTRFDVQSFRPAPGPRDLVIVAQSQPISDMSVSAGAYLSFALDPLVLLNGNGDRVLNVVNNRLDLQLMGTFGLWDWAEIGLVLPVVLFQQSGSLANTIGGSDSIQAAVLSDLALIPKVTLLRRLPYAKGLGLALALRVNFPTGSQEAFASDGAITFNPTVILDYRFGFGALLALQSGVYFRPSGRFVDLSIGPEFTLNAGGELPLVRRWGLGALAGVYTLVPLTSPPPKLTQIPAEFMLGLRWYSSIGVTFTTGVNFGIDCGFGVPSFRFFIAAVWVPHTTKEYESIQYFKKPPEDPDGDGIIGDKDLCPTVPGPVENHGCPILDTDKDGIPDPFDQCPFLPGLARYHGCPRVYAEANKIKVLERVNFATDQDVILPESFSVLEDVSQLMREHPEWLEILVEGHTDFRASDAYNLDLSQRRALSVTRFLIAHGVEPSRLRAQGFGRSRPLADNATEAGMTLNRRVEFTIVRAAPQTPAPAAPRPAAPAAAPRPGRPGGK